MFGAFQRNKAWSQLWQRPSTRTPPAGRGAASLVLGSDRADESAELRATNSMQVGTTGDVNDAKRLEVRGLIRVNEAPPVGYGWTLTTSVGGTAASVITWTQTTHGALAYPIEIPLTDVMPPIAGLGAAVAITAELEFIEDPDNPGGASPISETLLPSVYLDQLAAPETLVSDLYVYDRQPAPNQTAVPNDYATISFTLGDVNGTGVDLANTVVTIDGVVAYSNSIVRSPFTGTVTSGQGPTGNDVRFVFDPPAPDQPWASEQVIEVNVVSQLSGPVSPIDTTWVFTAADTIQPALQTASMSSKQIVRVTFTDDVLLDTSASGALNPENYAITRVSAPAVNVEVVGVSTVINRTDAVDLALDIPVSQGADYAVLAKDILDDAGNVLDATSSELRFVGYTPPKPAGRRFELLDFIPDMNLEADRTIEQGGDTANPGTGDLRKFVLVLQDVVDMLLCLVDEWPRIVDIDKAPEEFLDAILQDLGNPFAECVDDLSENEKRKLARILISIYKQKGTEQGIINAVRFFTGVEVTLDILNARPFWQLNVSLLGTNTTLAPPVGSPLWYSFWIVSPVVLTDDQRQRILCIAEYMKAAHEHVLGILEPGDVVTESDYWIMGVSLLGASSSPSTTLA